MKKRLFLLPLLLLAALSANAQNPYLPLWEHLPDGEPRVFEDPDNPGKLRAYIIGSHDTTSACGRHPLRISPSGATRVPSSHIMWMGTGTRCLPLIWWK